MEPSKTGLHFLEHDPVWGTPVESRSSGFPNRLLALNSSSDTASKPLSFESPKPLLGLTARDQTRSVAVGALGS